jgi:hypothetical protein
MKRSAILRRTRLRPVSKKRRGENAYYSKKRADFLARFQWCACAEALFGRAKRATEVHHKSGRTGTNFLDEATWLPVCRDSHLWIHANPSEARRRGWLK